MNVINYGVGLIDADGKTVTDFVTNIHIDIFSHTATFIVEKGESVDQIKMTMDRAQELGIINIQKLLPFIK